MTSLSNHIGWQQQSRACEMKQQVADQNALKMVGGDRDIVVLLSTLLLTIDILHVQTNKNNQMYFSWSYWNNRSLP